MDDDSLYKCMDDGDCQFPDAHILFRNVRKAIGGADMDYMMVKETSENGA